MTANRKKEAEEVIKRMARLNRCIPPEGELVHSAPVASVSPPFSDLIHLHAHYQSV